MEVFKVSQILDSDQKEPSFVNNRLDILKALMDAKADPKVCLTHKACVIHVCFPPNIVGSPHIDFLGVWGSRNFLLKSILFPVKFLPPRYSLQEMYLVPACLCPKRNCRGIFFWNEKLVYCSFTAIFCSMISVVTVRQEKKHANKNLCFPFLSFPFAFISVCYFPDCCTLPTL